jgi:Mg2+-importing ATPase
VFRLQYHPLTGNLPGGNGAHCSRQLLEHARADTDAVLAHEELEERLKANEEYRKIDEIPFDFVRRRMSVEHLLLGSQIETMSETELAEAVSATSVFARLAPAHKEHIIHALQSKGRVLGFMGDGINDAPALKAADVGISVDSAVDIAKESSDLILLEKSLMVLEQGVLEGRRVFGNIVKYIKMASSSNFGNMFSVVGASAFLPFPPMLPIQVLTNNLLYDFSQTTIPTDEVDAEWLTRPRKWTIGKILRFILFIGRLVRSSIT